VVVPGTTRVLRLLVPDALIVIRLVAPFTPSCVVVRLKRLDAPETFSADPVSAVDLTMVPNIFELTMFERFEVPVIFSEVPLMSVAPMIPPNILELTRFARFDVPVIFRDPPV